MIAYKMIWWLRIFVCIYYFPTRLLEINGRAKRRAMVLLALLALLTLQLQLRRWMVSVFINPWPIWTTVFCGFHVVFIFFVPKGFTLFGWCIAGKYVGNRPIKLRKSNWKERTDQEVLERQKVFTTPHIFIWLIRFFLCFCVIFNSGYLFLEFIGRTIIRKSQSHKRKGYYTSEQLTKLFAFLFLDQNDNQLTLYDCTVRYFVVLIPMFKSGGYRILRNLILRELSKQIQAPKSLFASSNFFSLFSFW